MAKTPITVDGTFSDWDTSELISTPVNTVPGYSWYGTVQNDTYFIGVQATGTTEPAIGAGTVIWLNTDQNTATGYSPFGSIGAEYDISYFAGDQFNPAWSTSTAQWRRTWSRTAHHRVVGGWQEP